MSARIELMRNVLPIIEAYFLARVKEETQESYGRFVVLGPTEEEIAAYAPKLHAALQMKKQYSGDAPYAREIWPTTDLYAVLADCWKFFGDSSHAYYVILDEETDSRKQVKFPSSSDGAPNGPDHRRTRKRNDSGAGPRIPEEIFSTADNSALLLAALLPTIGSTVICCPDEQLGSPGTRPLRTYLREQLWHHREIGTRFAMELRERTAKGLPWFDENTKISDPDSAKEVEPPFWQNSSVQLMPSFIWCWEVSGRPWSLVNLADIPPSFIHVRVFSPESAGLLYDADFVGNLIKVVEGQASRSEDDVFFERDDFWLTDDWHVHGRELRLLPMNMFIGYDDFPLRRMDEICSEIVEITGPAAGTREQDVLWMVLDGEDAGKISDVVSSEMTGRRCLKIRSDDDDFLYAIFLDQMVINRLIAEGTGAIHAGPILSARQIRELEVPWPNSDKRRELCKAMIPFPWDPDDIRAKANIVLEDIRFALAQLSELYEDSTGYVGLRQFGCTRQKLWQGVQNLKAILAPVAKADPEPRRIPSVLAIPARRYKLELEIAERIKQLFTMSEVLIRYDLALVMSILDRLKSSVALSHFPAYATTLKNGTFIPAFGQWLDFNKNARARLKQLVDKGRIPKSLENLVNRIAKVSGAELENIAKPIIEMRNRFQGHSLSSLPMPERNQVHEKLFNLHNLLGVTLSYCHDYANFYQESSASGRKFRDLSFLRLCGDNPLLDRNTVQIPVDQCPQTNDGEVYLFINDERPELISLSPWLLYRPGQDASEATVWMLDKEKGVGKWVYKSPTGNGSNELTVSSVSGAALATLPEIVELARELVKGEVKPR